MLLLTVRTDNPEAEIGIMDDTTVLDSLSWQAHRQLAVTIHRKIDEVLQRNTKSLQHIQGVVLFSGPGSFTGLRIGASVVNALGYALNIPVTSSSGSTWKTEGANAIMRGAGGSLALPEYGNPVHTTKQVR